MNNETREVAAAMVARSPDETHTLARKARVSQPYRNLSAPHLYEYALRRDEGRLAASGPLVVETGEHTGRSPHDKFIVREPLTEAEVWWGEINQSLDPHHFAALQRDIVAHLDARDAREGFVQDLYACADPTYRLRVRIVSEYAWSALFARNLFIVPTPAERAADTGREPDFTVLHAPTLHANPARHGTRTETAIVISFERRLVLIAGTRYAGEIKKAIFTVLQWLLPQRGVATLHCSANAGPTGDVALFFGLSGTGKTTLSTDPSRTLIGDDEHGWSDRGIFNVEGGSYAKVIDLSPEAEPEIWRASHRFGAILENVVLDATTREMQLHDRALTENTRAAFPLSYVANATTSGTGAHPSTLVFLTADAFGVLPPVARLTPAQALYWFLSGYSAKLAGTERGVVAPAATFSACFGAPFLPLRPVVYASLLGERIQTRRPSLWLVNTGWSGGPFGVGARMPIPLTRAIVRAIVTNGFDDVPVELDPYFGLAIPVACPDVPPDLLRPWLGWDEAAAYSEAAHRLVRDFSDNFAHFASTVPPHVREAGPRPSSGSLLEVRQGAERTPGTGA